jgi:hypothetical protein
MFELRRTKSDQLALMAYSSLNALVEGCGTGQPWTRIQSVDIPWLARTVGFDVILFDLALPPELRRPELDTADVPDLELITVDHNPTDRIYIPCRPFRPGAGQIRLELQPGPDGQPAMLVYFSIDQLRAGCGPHQAWVAFKSKHLKAVARRAGAHTVLFNQILPEHARHTASVAG